MNTQESPDFPSYGTVYATGNALLAGNTRRARCEHSNDYQPEYELYIVQELLPRPPAINLLSL